MVVMIVVVVEVVVVIIVVERPGILGVAGWIQIEVRQHVPTDARLQVARSEADALSVRSFNGTSAMAGALAATAEAHQNSRRAER